MLTKSSVRLLTLVLIFFGLQPAIGHQETTRCSRTRVRQLVHGFISDYNHGRGTQLDRAWAEEPDFIGYYVAPERIDQEGEERSTLLDYFRQRRELHDRLALSDFWTQRQREADESFDFYFEVQRDSDEPRARGRYPGKGNAGWESSDESCVLRLWNMEPLRDQRCTNRRAKTLVSHFMWAYNRGNTENLDELFAHPSEFERYEDRKAFVGRLPFVATTDTRFTLSTYFEIRHGLHDVLTLTDLDYSGGRHSAPAFSLKLERTADDIFVPGRVLQDGEVAFTSNCTISRWTAN